MAITKGTAVVYARYSSHRQGEQSIEGQLAAAETYAAANGLRIINQYIDRAQTGRTDNRDAFQRMLKDTAKKQFDTIILWKIDRFGRNRQEIAANKYRCKKNGVKVVYVAEHIPDSPEGVILESVLEGMAEYYSLQLAQNVTRGMRASAEKCQSTGGSRPLGYTVDPKTKKFVIDEDNASTVRLVFSMYAEGTPVNEIVKELNNRGLRTLKGKPFSYNSLHSILKNEKYIGIYTYNGQVRIEGGIPAIVDKETFNKVQALLKANKKNPTLRKTGHEFLLTDKLFCGDCGGKMVGESGTSASSGRKYYYYKCHNNKTEHTCNQPAIKEEWIESLVLTYSTKILHDDELLNSIVDRVYAFYQAEEKPDDEEISLKRAKNQVEHSIQNLVRAIEHGIFNDATKARMDELEIQKAEIESELAAIDLQRSFRITREQIRYFLNQFRNTDIRLKEVRQRLVETFINSIFAYENKVVITFNYSGKNNTLTLEEIKTHKPEFELMGYGEPKRVPFELFVYRFVFGISIPVYSRK